MDNDLQRSAMLAAYCWVLVGSQRRRILVQLNSVKLPSQICKDTGISDCNVSRVLKELVKRGLVSKTAVEDRNLYKATDKGLTVVRMIAEPNHCG